MGQFLTLRSVRAGERFTALVNTFSALCSGYAFHGQLRWLPSGRHIDSSCASEWRRRAGSSEMGLSHAKRAPSLRLKTRRSEIHYIGGPFSGHHSGMGPRNCVSMLGNFSTTWCGMGDSGWSIQVKMGLTLGPFWMDA